MCCRRQVAAGNAAFALRLEKVKPTLNLAGSAAAATAQSSAASVPKGSAAPVKSKREAEMWKESKRVQDENNRLGRALRKLYGRTEAVKGAYGGVVNGTLAPGLQVTACCQWAPLFIAMLFGFSLVVVSRSATRCLLLRASMHSTRASAQPHRELVFYLLPDRILRIRVQVGDAVRVTRYYEGYGLHPEAPAPKPQVDQWEARTQLYAPAPPSSGGGNSLPGRRRGSGSAVPKTAGLVQCGGCGRRVFSGGAAGGLRRCRRVELPELLAWTEVAAHFPDSQPLLRIVQSLQP
jgi:hypothetical protein